MGEGYQQQRREADPAPAAGTGPAPIDYGPNSEQALPAPSVSDSPLLDAAGQTQAADAPLPRVVDGDANQMAMIDEALPIARKMVDYGIAALAAGPDSDPGLFEQHLHTTDPGLLACAADKLAAVQAALAEWFTIEVDTWVWPFWTEAAGAVAGIKWVPSTFAWSNVHLMPKFFEVGALGRAHVIVHEAAHKWGHAFGDVYYGDAEYSQLTGEQAIENADSLTMFCTGAYSGGVDRDQREDRQKAEQAAARSAEAVWTAYQSGVLDLRSSEFTTPDGVVLDNGLVQDTVYRWFREHERAHHDEVCRWLDDHSDNFVDVTCADGSVVRAPLVEVVFWHIQ